MNCCDRILLTKGAEVEPAQPSVAEKIKGARGVTRGTPRRTEDRVIEQSIFSERMDSREGVATFREEREDIVTYSAKFNAETEQRRGSWTVL